MEKFDPKKPTEIRSKVYSARNKKELRLALHDVLSEINDILSYWKEKHKNEDIDDFFVGLYKFFEALSKGWVEFDNLHPLAWKKKEIKNLDKKLLIASEKLISSIIRDEIPSSLAVNLFNFSLYLEALGYKIDERVSEILSILDVPSEKGLSKKELKEILKEIKNLKKVF